MKINSFISAALCCGTLATLGSVTHLGAADTNTGPTVVCYDVPPAECGEAVVTSATVQDTNGSALTVTWAVNGMLAKTVNLDASTAVTPTLLYFTNTYPVGTNQTVVTVSDPNTNQMECATEIVVRDTQPPLIHAIRAMPSVLWPPNHQLRAVKVVVDADDCSAFTWRITQITSNEPVNGTGDGNTDPDWLIVRDHKALLRAERSGNGTGRIYTLTVEATDASGNSTNGTVTVTVPHDLGHYPTPDWALWWRHNSGLAASWHMAGTNCTNVVLLNPAAVDPAWRMAGTGDFNDDGKTQILWQHSSGRLARWLMQGSKCVGVTPLNPASVDSSWQVAGTTDLNDDGKAEVLWQHASGLRAYWQMEGTHCVEVGLLSRAPVDPNWRIVGAGDFDGDGKAEILWRHSRGYLAFWWMDGTNCVSVGLLNPSSADPSWSVAGTADVDGDGRTDIIWQHTSGWLAAWLMQGTNAAGVVSLTRSPVDSSWRISGPR